MYRAVNSIWLPGLWLLRFLWLCYLKALKSIWSSFTIRKYWKIKIPEVQGGISKSGRGRYGFRWGAELLLFCIVGWWMLVCCKISFRAWFIPLDPVLAGLEFYFSVSEKHVCSVPYWEHFVIFAIQTLSEAEKKKGKRLYPFQCTYLDWI